MNQSPNELERVYNELDKLFHFTPEQGDKVIELLTGLAITTLRDADEKIMERLKNN